MGGQTGLATAPGPGQRQQPHRGQEAGHLGQLLLAADEGGQLGGQVVGHPVQRAQRWEGAGKVGVVDLEDLLGPGQVPQPVAAKVEQRHAVGQGVAHQLGRGPGHHRLAAVGHGPEPGRTDDGRARVPALVGLRLPGVHGHAHADRLAGGPRLPGQGQLGLHRRRHRIRGPGEGGHHTVALPLLHRPEAAMGADGRGQDLLLAGDGAGGGRAVGLPRQRGPLHVGQEEGHRSRGRPHHGISLSHPAGDNIPRTAYTPAARVQAGATVVIFRRHTRSRDLRCLQSKCGRPVRG